RGGAAPPPPPGPGAPAPAGERPPPRAENPAPPVEKPVASVPEPAPKGVAAVNTPATSNSAAPASTTSTAPAPQPPAPAPAAAPKQDPPASDPPRLPPGVQKAQRSTSAPAAPRPGKEKSSPRDEALFEAAAAMLQQEEGARPEAPPTATFQPRAITESSSQFTGEPISLDLKDADIKDVFRTISQLTQLNIVVDPEVRGTVTVQLEEVPRDQALDLILKQHSLGYVLENNIMRIATSAKLQAEQADRARLSEARQAAEPTRTVIKKLSYARAQELTPTIKSVMSRRGDIVVDGRTNTLI